jgi:hypothetical protein
VTQLQEELARPWSLGDTRDASSEQDVRNSLPDATSLLQNYPNPFNPSTVIPIALATPAHVQLTVFNILGSKIATLIDGPLPAGYHSVRFSPGQLAGGVYLYVMRAGSFQEIRRMTFVK